MSKYKKRIYEIVEKSHTGDSASKAYDTLISIAVVVGLIPLTMKHENDYSKLIDLITSLVFVLDYLLRFYTSDYKMGIKSYKAYIAHCLTPMSIIDLLSIIPALVYFYPTSVTLGLFRIFRVFRVLKLLRYSDTVVVIENVLRRVKKQLFAVLMLTFMYILASAMFIFQLEPDLFKSFFEAVYWATISITTIGYGDISPVTTAGRALTMISALVGVAVIALPSGIVTAAYMDEIKKEKSRFQL
ncbi:voltage-gated potassium channel [Lachnospiraceae bacterium C7]|nr:voltage-gated potassium channel [Lachnospiraceae bacterium C7]